MTFDHVLGDRDLFLDLLDGTLEPFGAGRDVGDRLVDLPEPLGHHRADQSVNLRRQGRGGLADRVGIRYAPLGPQVDFRELTLPEGVRESVEKLELVVLRKCHL
jgi:hypothetical protein